MPQCLGNQAKLGNTTVSKCKAKDLKQLSAFPGIATKFCLRQSTLYGEFKPKQSKQTKEELNLIPGLVLRCQGQKALGIWDFIMDWRNKTKVGD